MFLWIALSSNPADRLLMDGYASNTKNIRLLVGLQGGGQSESALREFPCLR